MYLAVMYVQGVLGIPAGQASLLSPPSTWPPLPEPC
jgi:hypothetical protein